MYNLAHSGVPHSNLYPAISLVSISHIKLLGLLFLTLNLETKWTRTDKKFVAHPPTPHSRPYMAQPVGVLGLNPTKRTTTWGQHAATHEPILNFLI